MSSRDSGGARRKMNGLDHKVLMLEVVEKRKKAEGST
jgi:hypothetical protein